MVINNLILLDFDGTILKTSKFNWECYNLVLNEYHKNISFPDFLISINNGHLDIFFREKLGLTVKQIIEIREKKYELMYTHNTNSIEFIPGMKDFINFINDNGISHCVVTNTSIKPINMYKEHFHILKKLKNWITREDYKLPKPNPECYKLAIERYGKDKQTIGFEDSWVGFQALKGVVDQIYIINGDEQVNYDKFQKENVNLLENYNLYEFTNNKI